MGAGFEKRSVEHGHGSKGKREHFQIKATWCRVDRSQNIHLLSAPPRRLLDLPPSKEDASIDLIAGILSEMTALLSDEANKNLINST